MKKTKYRVQIDLQTGFSSISFEFTKNKNGFVQSFSEKFLVKTTVEKQFYSNEMIVGTLHAFLTSVLFLFFK